VRESSSGFDKVGGGTCHLGGYWTYDISWCRIGLTASIATAVVGAVRHADRDGQGHAD
jgi:hypothetical protein